MHSLLMLRFWGVESLILISFLPTVKTSVVLLVEEQVGKILGEEKMWSHRHLFCRQILEKKIVENTVNDAYLSLTQFWPESMMLICGFSFALFQNKHHSSKS